MARRKIALDDGTGPKGKSHRWWRDGAAGGEMVETAKRIYDRQGWRRLLAATHASLYSDQQIANISGYGISRSSYNYDNRGSRVSFNFVQSSVSTIASKFSTNPTRILFLTKDGDYRLQRKAEQLTTATDGLFYLTDYHRLREQQIREAGIFGTGLIKVSNNGKHPTAESVMFTDVFVNDDECARGKPRTCYQRDTVHREVLIEHYGTTPERRAIIEAADADVDGQSENENTDMVPVWEAWHLGPAEGKPGKHVMAIEGLDLVNEDWSRTYFPFPQLDWEPQPRGQWGRGIADILMGLQVEVNFLLRAIKRAHQGNVPRWLIEANSKVATAQLRDEAYSIVKYTGARPEVAVFQAMAPEVYAHLDRLRSWAYEQVGISQLNAAGQKPEGLNSGAALREHQDIQSERFNSFGKQLERSDMAAAEMMIDECRELHEKGVDVSITAPGSNATKTLKWTEVNLPKSAFVMQRFPSSFLPTTPAGQIAAINELIDGGFIPREHAMALIQIPDLKSVVSLESAAYDDIRRNIGNILDDATYEPPEDIWPQSVLEMAARMSLASYHKAKNDGIPEKNRELLLRYVDELSVLIKAKTPPPPAMPMAGMPGAPMLPPGPVPAAGAMP